MFQVKLTANKFKSKNAVVNFNMEIVGTGITLSFVELIEHNGKEFLTHSTNKKVDAGYKTTYHSYITPESQIKIIAEVKNQLLTQTN